MNCKKCAVLMLFCLSSSATLAYQVPSDISADEIGNIQAQVTNPEFISAEDLKAKLASDRQITIIDVRNTSSYSASANRIRGSIFVKLRRLAYRLSFAPLKDVPRDSQVVTYCACAHDEASIRAARILLDAGFKHVQVLKGGWEMWVKAKGQVQARPRA